MISNIEANNNSHNDYNSNENSKSNNKHTKELEIENASLKNTINIIVNYIKIVNTH